MAVPIAQLVSHLEDSGIVAAETLKDYIPPKASPKDAEELLRELIRQNKLTKFQADEVYKGRGKSLTLGNYVLMEKIGAGGMGQVFKARHRLMDRLVAIKMLPKAVMNDPSAITRFEREVKAAAKISHPNIVTAHDADQAQGIHFLVMEFVEGVDLSVLVRKSGLLPVDKAVNYVLQAARGLEAAHKQGIIHRDIKPANILLDRDGTIKILDMGLARLGTDGEVARQADLTQTGAIMGTVDYMAPEQAVNPKTADGRADIYSLGCSLFFLLTGKPIYDGETLPAKIMAHQNEAIPSMRAIRPDVPEPVAAVFCKMVAKQAADRYQNMSELIADLERRAGDQALPSSVPPASGSGSGPGPGTMNVADQPTLPPRAAGQVLVAATSQADVATPAEVDGQQRRLQKLLHDQNYDVAIPMLVKLAGRKEPLFHDAAAWAKSELPAAKQKQQKLREQVSAACVKAQKLMETFNYGAVAQVLEAVPNVARTDEVRQLLTLAGERYEDCLGLQSEIDRAVRARNYEHLLPLVNRFLKLKPDNAKMQRLARTLSRNKADRAVRDYKGSGWYFDVAGRLVEPKEIAGAAVLILVIFAGLTFALQSYLAGSREPDLVAPPNAVADARAGNPPAAGAKPDPVVSKPDVAPHDFAKFTEIIQDALDGKLAGGYALVVLENGKTVAERAEGWARAPWEKDDPSVKWTLDKPMFVSAISEAVTAAALLKLWEQRRSTDNEFSLDDPFWPHIRDICPNAGDDVQRVTIRQLLQHRTGFVAGNTEYNTPQAIANLLARPLAHEPGTVSEYQINDYYLVRLVLEQIGHVQYTAYVREHVLQPLGITQMETHFEARQPICGYLKPGSNRPGFPFDWQWESRAGYAGWYASARDLARFLYGLREHKILSPQTTAMMRAERMGFRYSDPGVGWFGIGGWRWIEGIGEGSRAGQLTSVSAQFTDGVDAVLLVNCEPPTNPRDLVVKAWRDSRAGQPKLPALQPTGTDQPARKSAAAPPRDQVDAVARKLVELNPGFDGKVTPTIEGDQVTGLQFNSDKVTDISPVRALTKLQTLKCNGSLENGPQGKLADLSPLRGMSLWWLECYGTKVSDLSPLQGMPLTFLHLNWTQVSDLSPLKEMPLKGLYLDHTPVTDISPLKGMPLDFLSFIGTKVADLSPVRGMPLTRVCLARTKVVDLSPLEGMALAEIWCDFKPDRDTKILRPIKSLTKINNIPVAEFWKQVDELKKARTTKINTPKDPAFRKWCSDVARMSPQKQVEAVVQKLRELNPEYDGNVGVGFVEIVTSDSRRTQVTGLTFSSDNVIDISPVRAFEGLKKLECFGSSELAPGGNVVGKGKLADLSPLRGKSLTSLACFCTQVPDLSPLKGMALSYLNIGCTNVADLSPLKNMPLKFLHCDRTEVSDLSPLKGMKLEDFTCNDTKVVDLSPLRRMPLKALWCDFEPERDTELLRSIKTLETINGKPAAEFWKDAAAQQKRKSP